MKELFKVAIVVLLVWWAWKWWKHRQALKAQGARKNSQDAAFGASTRVGSDLGSSSPVSSPPGQSLAYQAAAGAPTGGLPVASSPVAGGSIFSGCGCN